MDLSHVSTRELLRTLELRALRARADGYVISGEILQDEAESLLRRLPREVLNYPYEVPE